MPLRFPPAHLLGVPAHRRLPPPVLRVGCQLCPRHAEAVDDGQRLRRRRLRRRHRPDRLRRVRGRDRGRRRRWRQWVRRRPAGQEEAQRRHDNVSPTFD